MHALIEIIGLVGGGLFAAGCVPMAWRTWKAGRDLGTPSSTMHLLFAALVFYCLYLFLGFGAQLPFWFLVIELICWGVALWYHYFPRDQRCFDVDGLRAAREEIEKECHALHQ